MCFVCAGAWVGVFAFADVELVCLSVHMLQSLHAGV